MADPHTVRSQTPPAPPPRGQGPGRQCSGRGYPAGFRSARADTVVGRHLTGIGREGKDSDVIVAGSACILPIELGIFACFATIVQSVRLA